MAWVITACVPIGTGVRKSGDDDDPDGGVERASEPGHRDIGHDDLRTHASHLEERFESVGRLDHLETARTHTLGDRLPNVVVAIGHEHSHHVSSTSRILVASGRGANGFSMKNVPGSSTPWRTIASSV